MKILTTMDFITSYPNIEEFKGNSVQILTTDSKLDVEVLNKFFAASIIPEFIVTTNENMDYLTGYIMGRTLQGANSIILLTDKPFEMSALAHKKAVISDNFKQAKAVLDKLEKEEGKTRAPRKKANAAENVEAAPETVPEAAETDDSETVAGMNPPEVAEAPVEADKPAKKRGRKKKSETMESVAAGTEGALDESAEKEFVPDYSEIKKILEDCGGLKIADEYSISEDDLFEKVAYCVNASFEVVSYEAQLGIRFLNKPFCNAFYSATKKSYDLLKKASAKVRKA